MIKVTETYKSHSVHQMARIDQWYCTCDDCGAQFRLSSRWDRLVHWFQCAIYRSVRREFTRVFKMIGLMNKYSKKGDK